MNSEPEPKRIVIAGDVTVDWNQIFFQDAQDTTVLWNAFNRARACCARWKAIPIVYLPWRSPQTGGRSSPGHGIRPSRYGTWRAGV